MRNFYLLILVLLTPINGSCLELKLEKSLNNDLCASAQEILKEVKNIYTDWPQGWNYKQGKYRIKYLNKIQQYGALYASYDIDNDGNDEYVVYQSASRNSIDNEAIKIFEKNEIDFNDNPTINYQEFDNQLEIRSTIGNKWYYSSAGLYLINIRPFSFQERNYVFIFDLSFHEKGESGKSLVVAELNGEKIKTDSSSPHTIAQLNYICVFKNVQYNH